MKSVCKCGSYAINIDKDDRLCDVCYWKDKYNNTMTALENLKEKIENRKKEINKDTKERSKYHDGLMFCNNSEKLEELNWILSEIDIEIQKEQGIKK